MNKEPPLPVDCQADKDSKDPMSPSGHVVEVERNIRHIIQNETIRDNSNMHPPIITNSINTTVIINYNENNQDPSLRQRQQTTNNDDENSTINNHIRYHQEDDKYNRTIIRQQKEVLPQFSSTTTITPTTTTKKPAIGSSTSREIVIDGQYNEKNNNNEMITNKITIINNSNQRHGNFQDEAESVQQNTTAMEHQPRNDDDDETSQIVWCDMCNKEVKSWRHHEKTRLHQSNLWNSNRKRRPSPPRFNFINVKPSTSLSTSLPPQSTPTTNNENISSSSNSTPTNIPSSSPNQASNGGSGGSGGSNGSNGSNGNNTMQGGRGGVGLHQSSSGGSTSMIISQSSSSSSSNLSSNYALGNNNGYYSSKSDMLHNSVENIDESQTSNNHKRNRNEHNMSPLKVPKKNESLKRNTPSSSDSSTDVRNNNRIGFNNRSYSPPIRPSMNYIMNIQLTDSKTRHLFLSSTPEEQQQMFTNSEKGYAFMEQLKKFRNSEGYTTTQHETSNSQSHPQNHSHHSGGRDNQSNHRQANNNFSSNQYASPYQVEDRRNNHPNATTIVSTSNSQYNLQNTGARHVNNRNHSNTLDEPKNQSTERIETPKQKKQKDLKSLQFVDHFEQKTKKRK